MFKEAYLFSNQKNGKGENADDPPKAQKGEKDILSCLQNCNIHLFIKNR